MIKNLEKNISNQQIKTYSSRQIAEWFLAWAIEEPDSQMTALKIQKLLYYAQGHHLALFNQPLFSEKILAWEHGPVEPNIYRIYKNNSTKNYPIIKLENDFDFSIFSTEKNNFLISIWNTYGIYDGSELEKRTHNEKPWIENYYSDNINQEISQNELKKFFLSSP